ncbi:MAG: SpoIID/LytB domain-containing protein [Coriobacteriia bacterium]|nr:SpoIID/LytB domain-containing protein [Coriobacteriia bacterium]
MLSRSRTRSSRVVPAFLAALFSAMLIASMVFAPPASADDGYFTFMSRGFGHGLGMSQYGAKGFADAGYGYETILRHYYGSRGTDPKTQITSFPSEPSRDVNLDHAAGSGDAGYTKATWTLRPGNPGSTLAVYASSGTTTSADGWSTFTAEGNQIRWTQPGGRQFLYSGTIAVWGVTGTPALTQVKEGTGQYSHEYVRFRGELRLAALDGKLKLVNRLSMPEYLFGVVPRESPASWPAEALKAQAVAARNYSWRATRLELYTDTRDQVYGGHSRGEDRANPTMHEDSRTNAAVDATLGKCVTYDGELVTTYFMSTSGGYTENNESVWGGTALPHLRGVPDPYEVYSGASMHPWKTVTYTAADTRIKLLQAGMSASVLPDPIAAIRVTERGVSGRPMTVEFTSLTGVKTSVTGYSNMLKFRNAFAWGDHWFVVNPATTRIFGTDRYRTSVAASRRIFTSQGSANPAKAVVVANGGAPADALAASSLAGAIGGAPILLTPGGELDSSVEDEIARLGVTKAYVVGGTGVISERVKTQVAAAGVVSSVTRLGGVDRYETAKLIALEVKRLGGDRRVIIVNGDTLIDAVTAAGWAYSKAIPIIPVRAGEIPKSSADALLQLNPTYSMIIGGTAVVSDAVMAKLPNATRPVAGVDRYATARAMCWHLTSKEGFNAGSIYLASGTSMVDALAIGPVAGHNLNPLLLARAYELPSATRLELESRAPSLWRVHIAGGEAALSGWLQGKVEQAVE